MASSRITGLSENISTYGTGKTYTSLTVWEQFTDNDLVTAQVSEVLECYNDPNPHADSVTLASATSNASYRRIIRPASGHGHDGTPNTGVYFSGTSASGTFLINESYAVIQDLIITTTVNSASTAYCIQIGNATNAHVAGCIFLNCANAGSGNGHGIAGTLAGTVTPMIVNCLAKGNKNAGFLGAGGTSIAFYNCTSIGNAGHGFQRTAGVPIVKNCLAQGNTTADFSAAAGFAGSSTHNASGDATAPGTSARTSQTFTFVNAGSNDYHLAAGDQGAKNRGTDLRADATFAFSDDIDFDALSSLWSIGFDHYPVVGSDGGGLLLRGVGS